MKDGGATALPPLTEGELGAYLDGAGDAAALAAWDRRLDANPGQREEVERIRLAEAELVLSLDALLDEPVPGHLLALLGEDDDGPGQGGDSALADAGPLAGRRPPAAE
ncbi:hypothetical protein ACM64Y_05035 [Novispirillum sp. DQ9]|uniref:hypothetical protein n=1 Tax=Novispirillum sp. DQ9 TaxID=3398612 RepID=UPI003C7DFAC3